MLFATVIQSFTPLGIPHVSLKPRRVVLEVRSWGNLGRQTAMVSLPVMWPAMWRPLFHQISYYLPEVRVAVIRIPE